MNKYVYIYIYRRPADPEARGGGGGRGRRARRYARHGREHERGERERRQSEGERDTRGYEPFALHAPIHWSILGYVIKNRGRSTRLGAGPSPDKPATEEGADGVIPQLRATGRAFQGLAQLTRREDDSSREPTQSRISPSIL